MFWGCDDVGNVPSDDTKKLSCMLCRKRIESSSRGALGPRLNDKLGVRFTAISFEVSQRPDVTVLFTIWGVDKL